MSNKPDEQPWVPVVSKTGKPLMPCSPRRARKLLEKGKAVKRWYRGFFYIKLTEREDGDIQDVAMGVDPGSKREGYTVMSSKHTFLNINAHTTNGKGIKKSMEGRSNARRARRFRKTPCRQPRWSNRKRSANWLPPSTKARWQIKLNILKALSRLYPISKVAVEDVNTELKKEEGRRNGNFSPVMAGKNWLYDNISKMGYELVAYTGRETFGERNRLNLPKNPNKLSNDFFTHCVDSWVLANKALKHPHSCPEMREVMVLKPLLIKRRQLHKFNPQKGGRRPREGGTMSEGFKRGTLIFHPTHGKTYLGGNDGKGRISLHDCATGKRLAQNVKLEDCIVVAHSPWIVNYAKPKLPKELRVVYSKHRLCNILVKYVTSNPRIFLELKQPATKVA